MEEQILQELKNIYVTLNEVSVKGEESIACMYASMSKLKEVITLIEKQKNKQ